MAKSVDEVLADCKKASGDGPWYIHYINPHDSAEHHDVVIEPRGPEKRRGWYYGLWRHPEPAITPHLYEYVSQNLEAAIDTKQKLDRRSKGA